MLSAISYNIVNYKTSILEKRITMFLNNQQISKEEMEKIVKILNILEINLCKNFNLAFSYAQIYTDLKFNIFDQKEEIIIDYINLGLIPGPFQKMLSCKDNIYIYESGFIEKPLVLELIALLKLGSFIKNNISLEEDAQPLNNNVKLKKIDLSIYKLQFKVLKYKLLLPMEDLKQIFSQEIFENNKELILFFEESLELLLQIHFLNEFLQEVECEISVYNIKLNQQTVEEYLKKLIISGQIPGPFCKLISTTTNDKWTNIKFIVGFNNQFSSYLFFLQKAIINLFFNRDLSFIDFMFNTIKYQDGVVL